MNRRLLALLCAVVALALVGAGCGDDDDDGGGTSGGGGIGAGTGSAKAKAQKAGAEAAKQDGTAKLEPNKTVGFLQILGGIESADRTANAVKVALSEVGYKMVLCDGQGDPTKWATCADSLLGRGVDAIFTTGIEPNAVAPQLKKAKAQNIPFIQVGGLVSPGYDGSYYPDEPEAGKILADYTTKLLSKEVSEKPAQIIVHDYPAPWATSRTDELEKVVKASPDDYKITATTQTDPANLVNGTRKSVTDQITANPDTNMFWFSFDSAGQVGGQAVSAKYPGKTFPDKPLVATFHADLGTLELMKAGNVDVALDVPYDAGPWVGVDQLLQFWGLDKAFSKEPQPSYPGIGTVYDYEVVTKDNLPPEGKYRTPKNDFVTFFKTKWADQFGGGGAN
jgi:ABC-type sugar transport system substrate-binding protein